MLARLGDKSPKVYLYTFCSLEGTIHTIVVVVPVGNSCVVIQLTRQVLTVVQYCSSFYRTECIPDMFPVPFVFVNDIFAIPFAIVNDICNPICIRLLLIYFCNPVCIGYSRWTDSLFVGPYSSSRNRLLGEAYTTTTTG